MNLTLEIPLTHSDAVVQLIDDPIELVRSGVVRYGECRIVRAYFRDIAVLPITELRVVVAWHCVLCRISAVSRSRSPILGRARWCRAADFRQRMFGGGTR